MLLRVFCARWVLPAVLLLSGGAEAMAALTNSQGAQVQAMASAAAAGRPQEVTAEHFATLKKIIDLVIETVVKYSFQFFAGIIILVAGWVIAKFLARFAQNFLMKYKVDVTITKFIVGAVKLAVMAFVGLIALGKFGIEIAPFIAGLSVVGFGTSFALQGPLSNYAAGATLIFTKPFKVGDIIEVIGQVGEVEDMTLPRTIIKTMDNTRIIIPNKHIIGEVIHNFSDLKRLDIKVGVGYRTDVELAIRLLKDIIGREPRIVKNQELKVGISEFGDSSVNLYARLWCKQADYWDVMFTINKNIFAEYRKHQLEIPYPQRDVHIYQEKSK